MNKSQYIMDARHVDAFIMANNKYFRACQLNDIRNALLAVDESKWSAVQILQFKDPTIALIISLIFSSLAIDRFYIGDVGLGILKLLTCGGLGIWSVVDWFLVMGITRDRNLDKLNQVLRR